MASRFIVHFAAEKNGNSYDGERKIVAETSREAEAEFRREYPGIDGYGWSRTVTYTEQEPLSPDEEKKYYDEKKREQEERIRVQNEKNKRDYECILTDLQGAKSKVNVAKTSAHFALLREEFSRIAQALRSHLGFGPFDAQAEIEECETCRKQCEEKMNQCKKDETLSLFNTAKAKIPTRRTADEYGRLTTEFASIGQTFKSLPDSFDVQAEIEECETCRKQCEEKMNQCKKDETLSLFNTTKAKYPARRTADEYGSFATDFANIEQAFRSLPGSFGVQAQIEECQDCYRYCNEKKQAILRREEIKQLMKKVILSVLYFAIVAGLLITVCYFRSSLSFSLEDSEVLDVLKIILCIIGVICGFSIGRFIGCIIGGLIGYFLLAWIISLLAGILWIVIAVIILVLSILLYRKVISLAVN
jgi:hypothetical protein